MLMLSYLRTAVIKNHLNTPSFLILFVTDRCNSKCKHCFNWKTLNPAKDELSLSEIDSLARQLPNLETLAISGGEPFLREDISQIYLRFYKNCKHMSSFSIPTSCLLPKKILEKTRDILAISNGKGIVSINLSLDGLEKTHDYIRGVKGSFDKVFETYSLLRDLKKEFGNLVIRVNTTITNKNIGELSELIGYVKKNMPLIESHNFEFMRGKPKDPELKCPSVDKLRDAKKVISETFDFYKYFRNSMLKSKLVNGLRSYQYDLYLRIMEEKKQLIPCYAGKVHCVVDAQANVYFCELLPKVGNLREAESFLRIWYSDLAKSQRSSIKVKSCYCTHSCFQNGNIQFNPWLYPYILKDSLTYQRRKK
ncbi:MAG: radical SAM protein [Nanoarchaeota archaeon]